jgi:hypothetical protein
LLNKILNTLFSSNYSLKEEKFKQTKQYIKYITTHFKKKHILKLYTFKQNFSLFVGIKVKKLDKIIIKT